MRYFQILGELCHWDATNVVSSLEDAAARFSPEIVIVEAPDYVREGWAYDSTADGDARFIRPTPPDGWEYDDETGTFYQPGSPDDPDYTAPDTSEAVWEALAAAYREGVNAV